MVKNTKKKDTKEKMVKNTKEKDTKEKMVKNTKEKDTDTKNTLEKNTDTKGKIIKTASVGLGAAIVAHVLNKTKSRNDLQRLVISLFFNNKEIYFASSPEIIIIHNVIFNINPINIISIINTAKTPINVTSLCRALVVILDHPITNESVVLQTLDDVFLCFSTQDISIFPFLNQPFSSEDVGIVYQMQNFFSWQHVCNKKNMPFILPNETKATLKRLGLPTSNFCNNDILKNSLSDSFKQVTECLDSNNKIENCPILKELEPRKKDLMIYLEVSVNNIRFYNFLQANRIFNYVSVKDNFSETPWENFFALFCRQVLLCNPIHKPKDIEFLFKEFQGKKQIIFPTLKLFGIPNMDLFEKIETFFNNIKKLPSITPQLQNECHLFELFIESFSTETQIDNIFNFKLIGTNIYLSDIIINVINAKNSNKIIYENDFDSSDDTSEIKIDNNSSDDTAEMSSDDTPIDNKSSDDTSEIPIDSSSGTHSSYTTSSDDYYDAMEK
jgi:hypothetical protein